MIDPECMTKPCSYQRHHHVGKKIASPQAWVIQLGCSSQVALRHAGGLVNEKCQFCWDLIYNLLEMHRESLECSGGPPFTSDKATPAYPPSPNLTGREWLPDPSGGHGDNHRPLKTWVLCLT